ncbi:Non-specific lipid-transfer protein 2 [Sesamum alatum]|uniref:Non-specific lipid-transfer protein n=1 Tax=Sesamum alatum TaxID=300844 RepID=A0AAE2CE72_9LAMI|nr:Non-specific lipid-transfer protein 2 [Sesamum alatum]
MGAKFALVMLLCVAVLQVALFAHHAEAVVSCGQVQSGLLPCLGFLQGRALSPQCCPGVRSVVAAARTPNDRRTACRCLQAAAKSMRNINYGNAATLPAKCGVKIPFQISPNTDCSRVG